MMDVNLMYTDDYVVLVEEHAEIEIGDYVFEESSKSIYGQVDRFSVVDNPKKIIAHRPLNENVKEIDHLWLLPDFSYRGSFNRNVKYFTVEDIERVIEMAREFTVDKDHGYTRAKYDPGQILDSLKDTRTPVGFVPEFTVVSTTDSTIARLRMPLARNINGKVVVTGTYLYEDE